MIALLEDHHIAFIASPKCMTTSIGRLFLEIETGKPFNRDDHDGMFVHKIYQKRARAMKLDAVPAPLDKLDGYWKFTVVRDPIKRLFSAYTNRVVHKKEVEQAMARPNWQEAHGDTAAGLDPNPDANTFFANLEGYRDVIAPIRHHSNPMRDYIGADLSAYDRVFPVEKITELEEVLSARVGQPVSMPNAQRSKNKLKFADLSSEAQRVILAFTRSDYDLLSDYYRPEDVIGTKTNPTELEA